MSMKIGQHPMFSAARLTVANERIEGLLMPLGMMEHFGLCQMQLIAPCSVDDLDAHLVWLKKHKISTAGYPEPVNPMTSQWDELE